MKKGLSIIIILALAVLAFGCMNPDEKATQNNIMAYLNSMETISTQRNDLTEQFLILENSTDNQEISTLLTEEIMPLAKEVCDELENITIANEEINTELIEVHQQFIDGWTHLNLGLENLSQGLENKDMPQAEEGNKTITTAQYMLQKYYSDLEALCTKYDINLKTKTDSE